MNGWSSATAFFIARALLTTCGRNMRPEPNSSPTTFIPSISGPSMMASGSGYARRASSRSASTKSSTPCTSACANRASTVPLRQASSASFFLTSPCTEPANCTSRSVASGRRSKRRSSTRSSRSGGMSSYTASWPALTMPMSRPARIAWNRNAEWIASRTVSLPRNANERLLMPPLTFASGNAAFSRRVASMNAMAYRLCSSIPVPTASTAGSKTTSDGR